MIESKVCCQCGVEKPISEFHKKSASPDGFRSRCKACRAVDAADYVVRNKEKINAKSRARYAADPEKYAEAQRQRLKRPDQREKHNAFFREWRERNRAREIERAKEYYHDDREGQLNRVKKYQSDNPHVVRQNEGKRRAAKDRATPKWLSEDDKTFMQITYQMAKLLSERIGIPFHVDHIDPIQGKNVCGLHVPLNLRAIPASENMTKGNRTYEEAA